ncbi:MAG: ribosomal L7Ae/L30e/S12e/Gadd45 family protein [Oscillospiraceae bacterium]|nr:ribosomal L7Ae/L30e/S12e/Gadd45 family protein [Oscillospiraceae bacterium]
MNKLLSLLSLTKRAGKLGLGFDPVKESVQKREAVLVLLAADLSPKTKKEVRWFCEASGCPAREIPVKMDEIWYAVGKRSGVLAVTDEGLAGSVARQLAEQNKEETIL